MTDKIAQTSPPTTSLFDATEVSNLGIEVVDVKPLPEGGEKRQDNVDGSANPKVEHGAERTEHELFAISRKSE